jgi:hypothetical protein
MYLLRDTRDLLKVYGASGMPRGRGVRWAFTWGVLRVWSEASRYMLLCGFTIW